MQALNRENPPTRGRLAERGEIKSLCEKCKVLGTASDYCAKCLRFAHYLTRMEKEERKQRW